MKYRNLKITYEIDNSIFTVISVGEEALANPIPRHSHSANSYELHYIAKGHGTLIANGLKYELAPKMFYITGPSVPHEQISAQGDVMVEFGIYLKVSHEKKSKVKGIVKSFSDTSFWIGAPDYSVYELMKKIESELEEKPSGYEFMLPPLFKQLTIELSRYFSDGGKSYNASSLMLPEDLIELTIEEAFLYEYKELTLESLAKRINLGTRQTERLLKKHYSKTFSKMKTDARMSAAGLLLIETQDSINKISDDLGYSSAEHFSSAFKKYYGVSPTEYRQ